MEQQAYDAGKNITVNLLVREAHTKFKSSKLRENWCELNPEKEELLALRAALKKRDTKDRKKRG